MPTLFSRHFVFNYVITARILINLLYSMLTSVTKIPQSDDYQRNNYIQRQVECSSMISGKFSLHLAMTMCLTLTRLALHIC